MCDFRLIRLLQNRWHLKCIHFNTEMEGNIVRPRTSHKLNGWGTCLATMTCVSLVHDGIPWWCLIRTTGRAILCAGIVNITVWLNQVCEATMCPTDLGEYPRDPRVGLYTSVSSLSHVLFVLRNDVNKPTNQASVECAVNTNYDLFALGSTVWPDWCTFQWCILLCTKGSHGQQQRILNKVWKYDYRWMGQHGFGHCMTTLTFIFRMMAHQRPHSKRIWIPRGWISTKLIKCYRK